MVVGRVGWITDVNFGRHGGEGADILSLLELKELQLIQLSCWLSPCSCL